jgi:hypothetical protein
MPSYSPIPSRKIARQATSAVAYVGDEPDEDDPLLAFAPFLHKAPRRNSITPDLQRRFVATLAATGVVKVAAKRIGKSLEALYKLRARPGAEGFAAAWDAAIARGAARLEDIAMERAMLGTRTPIVSGGEVLGWWDKPDNALLRFLLAHRLPARYGSQAQELGRGHPAYDELAGQARAEISEIRRRMSAEVTSRAMALQVFRRRRLWRQRQAAGANAGPIEDAWDASGPDGRPELPDWAGPAMERAREILAEMEEDPPF